VNEIELRLFFHRSASGENTTRNLAKRMDAKTTEIPSSHVVMLSHPEETAAVIIQAAGK
jgi:hypothetical protein